MSIRVFRNFLVTLPNGEIDASDVISRECYQEFLNAKVAQESDQEAKKFYRVLTTHLTGVDGRRAFDPAEEQAILQVLRRNKTWPCFPSHLSFGQSFRGKGFHEKLQQSASKQQQQQQQQQPPNPERPFKVLRPTPKPPKIFVAAETAPSPESLKHIFDIHEPDTTKFVRALAFHVCNFSNIFASFGINVFSTVIGTLRFVLLSRVPHILAKSDAESYAKKLCDELSKEHEMDSVMIWDLTNREFTRRVMAQSARSVELLGSRNEENSVVVVQPDDLFSMVTAIANSYLHPGQKFTILQRLRTADGTPKLFEVIYLVDPQSFLLIGIGKLCE